MTAETISSILGGMMFKTENPATDYQTGTEYHVGALAGQHFSKRFAVGLTGYYYGQASDDEGALVGAIPVRSQGFRSSSLGGGLAVTFIGKWLHDFEAQRRLEADLFMLSIALKF